MRVSKDRGFSCYACDLFKKRDMVYDYWLLSAKAQKRRNGQKKQLFLGCCFHFLFCLMST